MHPSALAGSNLTEALLPTHCQPPLTTAVRGWLFVVKFEDFPVCVAISGAREFALGFSEHETFVEDHYKS